MRCRIASSIEGNLRGSTPSVSDAFCFDSRNERFRVRLGGCVTPEYGASSRRRASRSFSSPCTTGGVQRRSFGWCSAPTRRNVILWPTVGQKRIFVQCESMCAISVCNVCAMCVQSADFVQAKLVFSQSRTTFYPLRWPRDFFLEAGLVEKRDFHSFCSDRLSLSWKKWHFHFLKRSRYGKVSFGYLIEWKKKKKACVERKATSLLTV